MKVEKISHDELYEYWSQINDESFDSRLQIFFDMYVSVTESLLNYLINLINYSPNHMNHYPKSAHTSSNHFTI